MTDLSEARGSDDNQGTESIVSFNQQEKDLRFYMLLVCLIFGRGNSIETWTHLLTGSYDCAARNCGLADNLILGLTLIAVHIGL